MKAIRRSRLPGLIDQNAGGFTLTIIPNLIHWFRADSLQLSDDDDISVWIDESGNKNNAVQSSESLRPIYKVNILNSQPVVRFGPTRKVLAFTSTSFVTSSHFIVCNRVSAAASDAYLTYSDTDYTYLQYASDWHAANGFVLSIPMVADTFFLKECTYDLTNARRYTNGAAETPQACTSHGLYQFIGSYYVSGNLVGDIAEIVVYDRVLETAERVLVENYLNAKYNLW